MPTPRWTINELMLIASDMGFNQTIAAPGAGHIAKVLVLVAGCGLGANVWADIYTCTDASGRKITSDTPIVECQNREQRVINSAGVVQKIIGSNLSAQEQAKVQLKLREDQAKQDALLEQKRKDRALLARYANANQHDQERARQLGAVDDVIRLIDLRSKEMLDARAKLQQVIGSDVVVESKKRAAQELDDNQRKIVMQKQSLETQLLEKKRINARFDAELVRLQRLWADGSVGVR